jgi:plasmid stabilization system protein ParE
MKIVFKETFLQRLESQIEYLVQNSSRNARKFKDGLMARIKEIPSNPYRHRQSLYFEDASIRDITFKGYTIVFRITDDAIELFGLLRYQKYPHD